jgi:hypothetical protein
VRLTAVPRRTDLRTQFQRDSQTGMQRPPGAATSSTAAASLRAGPKAPGAGLSPSCRRQAVIEWTNGRGGRRPWL